MRYAIICCSRTGNTARLAERARRALDAAGAEEASSPADADVTLLGSWTDKGGLDPSLADALPALAGRRVFIFGTCGFGGDPAYYDRVLDSFASALPAGAEVVGRYMCQGQMPPAVRERYVTMAEKDPARFEPMIENFDRALGHPDDADLAGLVDASPPRASSRPRRPPPPRLPPPPRGRAMPSARRVRRALAAAAAPAPFADARVIGLPRALMTYRLGAKWRAFFEELGREVRVTLR